MSKQQLQTVMEALRLSREVTSRLRLHESITTVDLDRLDLLLRTAIDNIDHDFLPQADTVPIPTGRLELQSYARSHPVGFWVQIEGKTVAELELKDVVEAAALAVDAATKFERPE
jgi:hypothetical protein